MQLEQSRRESDIYRFLSAEIFRALIFRIGQTGGSKGLPPPENFTVAKMLDKPRHFRATSIFKIPQVKTPCKMVYLATSPGKGRRTTA